MNNEKDYIEENEVNSTEEVVNDGQSFEESDFVEEDSSEQDGVNDSYTVEEDEEYIAGEQKAARKKIGQTSLTITTLIVLFILSTLAFAPRDDQRTPAQTLEPTIEETEGPDVVSVGDGPNPNSTGSKPDYSGINLTGPIGIVPISPPTYEDNEVTGEEPKNETPKDEEPKDETPKDEEPKDETPKDEIPKDEGPKNNPDYNGNLGDFQITVISFDIEDSNKNSRKNKKELPASANKYWEDKESGNNDEREESSDDHDNGYGND